jgi:DNA-binding NarL/FixJ family response regulator
MEAVAGSVVGRESELSLVRGFLEGEGALRAFVLEGVAGIGKTTVWQAALDAASASGSRVLCARAAESEVRLSFAALGDLLEDVSADAFVDVPAPQRRALEVILRRCDPAQGHAPDSVAAFAGLAGVLRCLAADLPLVIGIDDVSWLDPASTQALAFAARRLRDRRATFLLTRRTGGPSTLERAFSPLQLERVELRSLSLGATRLLLTERLGVNLARRALRQLYDTAAGNPLVALMLGREIAAGALRGQDLAFSVPAVDGDLFDQRVMSLPATERRALLAVALTAELGVPELTKLVGGDALAAALASGVLATGTGKVFAAHPLFAAAARRVSSVEERRRLHLELAQRVADPTQRLYHAALAAEAADAYLARRLTVGSTAAMRRGDVHAAIELGDHALRLSPADDAQRTPRLLGLAEHLVFAGEFPAVSRLLGGAIDRIAPGPERARAHLLLGAALPLGEHEQHLESALLECGADVNLRASALAAKSVLLALIRVARIPEAVAIAAEGLRIADQGAAASQQAMQAFGWAAALHGSENDTAAALSSPSNAARSLYESASDRPAAVRKIWRGELGAARAALSRLLALAEERGEARSSLVLQLHLCELELRSGDTSAASHRLSEWEAWSASEAPEDVQTMSARCRALLATIHGRPAEVQRWARITLAASERSGFLWDRLEALRARGLGSLFSHDADGAIADFGQVWSHTRTEGVGDPGAFPVAPDLIEALLQRDRSEDAAAVAGTLRRLAEDQQHPWALASALRCEAMLSLAAQPDLPAIARLADAAGAYAALGLRFDQARTLLAAGRAARRLRKWSLARTLLHQADEVFGQLGASGWALAAQDELSRTGGRKPRPPGQLTEAEAKVARLAADGLSNKEIAGRLVVSVSTVETHLRHAYGKLGVHTRTQLGRRLASEARPAG